MYRYLCIVWNANNADSLRVAHSFRATLTNKPNDWSTAHEGPNAVAVHSGHHKGPADAYQLNKNRGVVLGTLFRRLPSDGTYRQPTRFDQGDADNIVASGGRYLVEQYWGAYVALLHDEQAGTHHVLRDPSGSLPCYHTNWRGVDVFFSHVEDCIRLLPITFEVSRHYLVRWLMDVTLLSRDCGLQNVQRVVGGERLTIHQERLTRTIVWNPVEIARNKRFEEPADAARELRRTVQNTINAWASCYGSIMHKLSGGLDSSIVAACLAQAPSRPDITYLNFAIDVGLDKETVHLPGLDRRSADKLRSIVGQGDERYFAHLVAERWRVPLIEIERDVSMDLTRTWQAPLMTSPPMFFTGMEIDDAEIEFARTRGTQAFFSGQGGDSVFLATMDPFGAVDYAYLHGVSIDLWRHIAATSLLTRDSVWSALRNAVTYGVLRRPFPSRDSVLTQPTLLNEHVLHELAEKDFSGPWDDLARSLPPGKQHHVKGCGGLAFYDYVFHSQRYADHIDPLNSQPIWELMLQIPSYTALAGGVSRGLARRAFADVLPTEIRKRQVKGSGAIFYQHLIRRNLAVLREKLLDGRLVHEGYLDRQKLGDCLATDEPFVKLNTVQILSYLSAEAWLAQWADPERKRAAA